MKKQTKKNKPRTLVLTGISEELRLIAKKAAKANELTLAEWFEGRIMDYDNQRIWRESLANTKDTNPMHSQENMRNSKPSYFDTYNADLVTENQELTAENYNLRMELHKHKNKSSFWNFLTGR